MGRLSEILTAGGFGGDDFNDRWKTTGAADDFGPLPPGEYLAMVERGDLKTSARKQTPAYALTFRVLSGPGGSTEQAGRLLWLDLWLTPTALPMTKRDLLKLGVSDPAQLERPLPAGIVCRVRIALRRDDDGVERNRVVRFDVDHVEAPEADPYAPEAGGGQQAEDCDDGQPSDPADRQPPAADSDTEGDADAA